MKADGGRLAGITSEQAGIHSHRRGSWGERDGVWWKGDYHGFISSRYHRAATSATWGSSAIVKRGAQQVCLLRRHSGNKALVPIPISNHQQLTGAYKMLIKNRDIVGLYPQDTFSYLLWSIYFCRTKKVCHHIYIKSTKDFWILQSLARSWMRWPYNITVCAG